MVFEVLHEGALGLRDRWPLSAVKPERLEVGVVL
jgi:hypothetical protein